VREVLRGGRREAASSWSFQTFPTKKLCTHGMEGPEKLCWPAASATKDADANKTLVCEK
jgi:hypothetical protein